MILTVEHLSVRIQHRRGWIYPVQNVSCQVEKNEIVGIVGESGSGKTMFALSLGRLLPEEQVTISAERMNLSELDLLTLPPNQWRQIRGRFISYVFQDSLVALHPHLTIGYQLMEPLRIHLKCSRKEAKTEAIKYLQLVQFPDPISRLEMYPHQLSGGMRQRVAIAMALITKPQLLIADEPTTSLDATLQIQVWQLLKDLYREQPFTMLLITHDLSLVAGLCSQVWIMYAGRFLEIGATTEIFQNPAHPYTYALLSLRKEVGSGKKLKHIPGSPPNLNCMFEYCPFTERCEFVTQKCHCEKAELQAIGTCHSTACIRVQQGEIQFNKR